MECKNCQSQIDENINFCPNCGAQIIRNRLEPKILINQLNDEVLSIDNRLLKTFIDLFKKPEMVIDGFNNGLRKRYINVLSYYAIALSVLGLQMFILKEYAPDFLNPEDVQFGPEIETSKSNPFLDSQSEINAMMLDYQNILFTIFMPFMAIGTWIVYLDKKKYNYTEHLVLNIYINAQWIFIGFVIYLAMAFLNVKDFFIASLLATPISIIYGSYVFKRIFETSYISALLRYFASFMIYMIAFFIIFLGIMLIILAYLFTTGKMN